MRPIDADAYAAEMKARQDALKELMDDADALDNWEMYDGLSRAFSVFVEAKLTLDAMPTVDAVPVVAVQGLQKMGFSYSDRTKRGRIRILRRIMEKYPHERILCVGRTKGEDQC